MSLVMIEMTVVFVLSLGLMYRLKSFMLALCNLAVFVSCYDRAGILSISISNSLYMYIGNTQTILSSNNSDNKMNYRYMSL